MIAAQGAPEQGNLRHLHFALQLVLEDTVEFLDIVLQERIEGFPAKRFGQFGCACFYVNERWTFYVISDRERLPRTERTHVKLTDGLIRCLKMVKDTLQCQRHALCWMVVFCWDLIHGLA